jgi:simple sugar transport system ATP-binding protein
MESEYAVELRGISKQFPGGKKKANSNISLNLFKGEILCIAGENGAGKTTLMKILSGLEKPDSGNIFINGKKAVIDSALTAKKLGIGMVHQHFMLFPELTVAENIVTGVEPRKWAIFYDEQKADTIARKIINDYQFNLDCWRLVKELTLSEMQQVEICRIIHRNTRIIILDEPTSILTEKEADIFLNNLVKLRDSGKSIILITHKLNEIWNICDRVAVLHKGELAGIREVSKTDEHEVAGMMIGKDIDDNISRFQIKKNNSVNTPVLQNEPVISFENVTVVRKMQKRPLLDNVSFTVRSGEIVAFTGVSGNGLGVLEAVLGGFLSPLSGKILHCGNDISSLHIRRLRNQGLAYVPADRVHVGSASDASAGENLLLNRRDEFKKWIFIDKKKVKEFSAGLIQKFNITGTDEKAAFLSGGNLQKLILARETDWLKDYIVFSQPTWGLDIASGIFVLREIAALKEKGAAVILISSNLDDILKIADKIMVMYSGKLAGAFINDGDPSLKEKIGMCMQGLPQ